MVASAQANLFVAVGELTVRGYKMEENNNGNSTSVLPTPPEGMPKPFATPTPKPGLQIATPSPLRRLRRSLGGTVAYLASWWRY